MAGEDGECAWDLYGVLLGDENGWDRVAACGEVGTDV